MSPLPHDFDPATEQEVYDIFGALRGEVYAAIKDLAAQIFARIELEQVEDERVSSPDVLSVIEKSLLELLRVIIAIFEPNAPDTTRLPHDEERAQAEREEAERAVAPKLRRSGRKTLSQWTREEE